MEGSSGNWKTKMVTMRLDKRSIDSIVKRPTVKPFTFPTPIPNLRGIFAREISNYEVECEFHEYLRRQSIISGYADYHLEVTDDEAE